MQSRFLFLILLFSLSGLACDRNHTEDNPVQAWLECDMLGECPVQNTTFGMVGDSWTDLFLGTDLYRDMHDWLVLEHGYRITSANLGGQTLQSELIAFQSYRKVIRTAGPELRYMLISLGGNDLLANLSEYTPATADAVIATRINAYRSNLLSLMILGDAYKQELYGGPPLNWVLHGYDYGNPELVTACNYTGGFTEAEKVTLTQNFLDQFNAAQIDMASGNPYIHHIELRGTLGGPPTSDPNLKADCIHPTDAGFGLISARYAISLQQITQER